MCKNRAVLDHNQAVLDSAIMLGKEIREVQDGNWGTGGHVEETGELDLFGPEGGNENDYPLSRQIFRRTQGRSGSSRKCAVDLV